MNSFIKIFLLCPIPEDQKPINEYIGLKNNSFFNRITSLYEISGRKMFFFLVLGGLFLVVLTNQVLFFFNLWFFFLLIIFFRWNQLKKRFEKAHLFYEEASWYDGQFWEKPFFILKNDRFVSTQQIQPFLEKMGEKILLFFLSNLVFLLLFVLK